MKNGYVTKNRYVRKRIRFSFTKFKLNKDTLTIRPGNIFRHFQNISEIHNI